MRWRANTRACTNILSTLYLATARLVAQSQAFLPERFPWPRRHEMPLGTLTLGGTVCGFMSRKKRHKNRPGQSRVGRRGIGGGTQSLHKKPWAGCANESPEKLGGGSGTDSVTNHLPVQSGISNRRGGGDR